MSRPIIYSAETIGDAYAPSLNAAFAQLRAASGITPVVLRPYGGDRTLAEQRAISPAVRDPSTSDHVKGRAVDIDNHRALRNKLGGWFELILASHGWRNIDLSGRPFPSEPWHFASRTPAAAGGNPQPLPEPKDNDMIERRLLRQEGTIGVYKQVNNTLTPVIDEQQLLEEQAGFRALAAAGDAFLSQVGSTLADVVVVKDLRRAGVKLGESTWNPTAEQLAAIGAAVPQPEHSDTAVVSAIRELAKQAALDHASTLAMIARVDDELLASLGLQRIPAGA